MEKSCEFCTGMRPVVYCQADAAYLCLSCDAKVHSANTLSSRHLRTLLCDACGIRPAFSRCLDHQMFICQSCDRSLHGAGASSQHRRRLVSNYVGCPSAKDFASLWGFEVDNLDRNADPNQLLSAKTASANSAWPCNVETEIGSTSQQFKIIDLKKLQLNEVNGGSPSWSEEEGQATMMTFSPLKKHDNDLDWLSDLDKPRDHQQQQQLGHSLRKLKVDVSTSPISQVEPSPFNPLAGDSFWQSISPGNTNQNQLWSQNMQDIGVCDEILCHDNFDIPDVDISFSNYEELFRSDEIGAPLNDRDGSCSVLEKLKGNNGKEKQEEASAAYNIQGNPNVLRPSYSTLSFTVSRESTEQIGTEFLDGGFSPRLSGFKASCLSYDMEASPAEARENALTRYKEKKKTRRNENQVPHSPRRPRSDVKKRASGKLVIAECDESVL